LEENDLLKIKKFLQGRDEDDWVRVWNAAFKGYDDMRQITVEEFRIFEKAPEFDPEGRFIAEFNKQSRGDHSRLCG
jgi:hypothetical protein